MNHYLINQLANSQPIVFRRPRQDSQALKASIDREYVSIYFQSTGTEIGMKLYLPMCNLDSADFLGQKGTVDLSGGLTLDDIKVRCDVTIDLASCTGSGSLTELDEESYEEVMGRSMQTAPVTVSNV